MSTYAPFEELASLTALEQRLTNRRPLLVDVFGDPCINCTNLAALEAVAASINGRAELVRMSADRVPELGSAYGLQMIPALLLFLPPAKLIKFPSIPDSTGRNVTEWVLGNLPTVLEQTAPSSRWARQRRGAAA